MNKFIKASLLISKFKNQTDDFVAYLETIYGKDNDLITKKTENYITVLKCFIERYSDREVIISRAPGRVNLMGRHVEHRGGNINTIAIHDETIMVAALREDDKICISNVDKKFGDYSFGVSEEIDCFKTDNWIDYIDNAVVKERVLSNKGHWSNYVKSGVLGFCFKTGKISKGMDIMCLGTVPVAGGLSSSSSIVMATAELVCEVNGFEFELPEFITLCGQSEWYVGSRGGAGDHAAIKCGVVNSISPISFEPVKPHNSIKLPDTYSVIVANSFIEAKKSEGAKDKFNQMVAAYEFGAMLIKKNFPQHKEKIIHLRDINPVTLGVSEKEIYEMLLSIPLTISPDELYEQIPKEYHEKVRRITRSHKAPDSYNLRSAVLYGICECERSRICSELLADGKTEEFAQIMNISHNGDRVCITIDNKAEAYDFWATDDKIEAMIKLCDENNPEAMLYKQPGGYGCSVGKIDLLIDSLLKEKGVLSAQISGAGLGGCIMILCEKEFEKDIIEFLYKNYYEPDNHPDGAMVVKPIKGSMCLDFN